MRRVFWEFELSTVDTGNRLEDDFFDFLVSQQEAGQRIYGVYEPSLCAIHKKKKYYCKVREAFVEFDLVVELYREHSETPHMHLVFECKNHKKAVGETAFTDFSSKLERIFRHSAKGVMVVSGRVQSGAEKFAKNYGMGIAKYDRDGLEFVLDRSPNPASAAPEATSTKNKDSFQFSSYFDGNYFSTIEEFTHALCGDSYANSRTTQKAPAAGIRYLTEDDFLKSANETLQALDYHSGVVDLSKVCDHLSIELERFGGVKTDEEGNAILGSAHFGERKIVVYHHENRQRERFTIAHEIGHFVLGHEIYMKAEVVLEQDLFLANDLKIKKRKQTLEIQANRFASFLLLPDDAFNSSLSALRRDLGILDRGHGYIYVDDQECNYTVYNELLSRLSNAFDVSKQVIEIRLSERGLLNDRRQRKGWW